MIINRVVKPLVKIVNKPSFKFGSKTTSTFKFGEKVPQFNIGPKTNPATVTTPVQTEHPVKFGQIKNKKDLYRYDLYNRTADDLKKECDRFKTMTGAELHVPDTMASSLFGGSCTALEWCAKDGNFPKDIKHVLVGHGYGSSVAGTWGIIGRGGNVFHYINNAPNIKKGEKVLVLCCEQAERVPGRHAIGDSVILSLTDSLHPGKVVLAGENKIAGEFYFPRLLEDNTKPSYYMYSDKPLFTIKKQ